MSKPLDRLPSHGLAWFIGFALGVCVGAIAVLEGWA